MKRQTITYTAGEIFQLIVADIKARDPDAHLDIEITDIGGLFPDEIACRVRVRAIPDQMVFEAPSDSMPAPAATAPDPYRNMAEQFAIGKRVLIAIDSLDRDRMIDTLRSLNHTAEWVGDRIAIRKPDGRRCWIGAQARSASEKRAVGPFKHHVCIVPRGTEPGEFYADDHLVGDYRVVYVDGFESEAARAPEQ